MATETKIDKKFIQSISGKDFVKYDGLLNAGHDIGLQSIKTTLIKYDPELKQALVTATVTLKSGAEFDGIGDASPQNVNSKIAVHLIRMAETRAKARALRDACNIGMCSVEELGGEDRQTTNKVVETEIPAGTLMTSTAKMLFGEVKGLEVRLVTDKSQIKSQLAWANKKDKGKFCKFIQAAEARILELDKGINQTHKTIMPKQPSSGMPEESNIDDINAQMDAAYMEKVNGNDVSAIVERMD